MLEKNMPSHWGTILFFIEETRPFPFDQKTQMSCRPRAVTFNRLFCDFTQIFLFCFVLPALLAFSLAFFTNM